jgi:hypothetical protein
LDSSAGPAARLPRPSRAPAAARGAAKRPAPPGSGVALLLARARGAPRLTPLGTGLATVAATTLGAGLDLLATGHLGVLFGVCFLAACVAAGLTARAGDLSAAPISAPIAFGVALALSGEGAGDGLQGRVVGFLTSLATHTTWLYAGTLLAAGVAVARHLARGPAAREPYGPRGAAGRSPRG